MTLPLGIDPERARGVLLGAAVGDALGWPQEDRNNIVGGARARNVQPGPEFRTWRRNAGTQFARYEDTVRQGEYSDDTQLLLAVARSCERGDDWFRWLSQVELPIWPLYQRGGGRAVLAASRAWLEGHPPWIAKGDRDEDRRDAYFKAGANGVAMRIAPHALVTSNESALNLVERIILDGISTHGHCRALIGGVVHGLALRHALAHRGTLGYGDLIYALLEDKSWRDDSIIARVAPQAWLGDFKQVHGEHATASWRTTVHEMLDLLHHSANALSAGAMADDERVLGEMGCFDKKRNGAGTITAAATLYVAARSAARPLSGLLRTAFLQNADSDTLASMTASLLSAVHGAGWMGPLARSVQDAPYINDLAMSITHGKSSRRTTESVNDQPSQTTNKAIGEFREAVFGGKIGPFRTPDGRPIELIHHELLDSRGNATVERVIGRTGDGQSLFFDRVSRGRRADEVSRRYERYSNADQNDKHQGLSETLPDSRSESSLTSSSSIEGLITGLHLRVRDVKKAAVFYGETLGIACEWSADQTVRVGSVMVLHRAGDNEALGATNRVMITLQVKDVQAVSRRLRDTAHPYGESRQDQHQLSLRDLDGYLVQIVQS